jgi:hypothetical protein
MGLFGIPSKKEREMQKIQIDNCRRIFTDSMKIMTETDNIDTFMSRRQVLREALYEAGRVAGENSKCLNGVTPKEALETFDRDIRMILDPCIARYMRKQTIRISNLSKDRAKKAQGIKLVISTYEEDLPDESIKYWNRLVDKLVAKIQKLESDEAKKLNP